MENKPDRKEELNKPANSRSLLDIVSEKLTPGNVKKGAQYLSQYGIKQFGAKLFGQLQREEIDYKAYREAHTATKEELEYQRSVRFPLNPVISIIVPVYKTPESFLRQMIESVLNQTYPYLELCIADGSGDGDAETEAVIRQYADLDGRIKYKKLEENLGISENSNAALKLAKGQYIGLLDHDDFLALDALFEVVKVINENQAEAVYTDEDKVTGDGERFFEPHFKPDFDLDLLRSNNYICHFFVVKADIVQAVNGFRAEFDGSQDYDFIFRCLERARVIRHIPKMLYHWRIHAGSVAENPNSKAYAYEAGRRAIESHLDRLHIPAEVENSANMGYYRVRYKLPEEPLVSVVIRDMNRPANYRKAVDTIKATTAYHNYEIIKEAQLFRAKGEYIVFFSADLKPESNDWLMEMVSHCARLEIGIVGGKIYKGNVIYKACTLVNEQDETKRFLWAGKYAPVREGFAGGGVITAVEMFAGLSKWNQGYFCKAIIQQQTSAVSSLCMMVKKSVYFEHNGFNRSLEKGFVGIDFCLRVLQSGKRIVFTPYAAFTLRES